MKLEKVYTIRGRKSDGYPRYIQFWNENPVIVGRCSYRANNSMLFDSREQAERFLNKFLDANNRRDRDITWEVVDYRPKKNINDFVFDYKPVDTIYGNGFVDVSKYKRYCY